MKIVVLDKQSNAPSRALVQGFRAAGENVSAVYAGACLSSGLYGIPSFPEADLAVVNGMQGPFRVAFDWYHFRKIPVLVAEQGHIKRGEYFQLGWNMINWLPPAPCPDDRRKALKIIPNHSYGGAKDGYVLILGQKPADAQHGILNIVRHTKGLLSEIREHTERPVVFRRHPLDHVTRFDFSHFGIETHDPKQLSLEESFKGAQSVVTHNSNAGIKAILKGIPVFCDVSAPYGRAAECGGYNIEDWHLPTERAFVKCFNRIAYAQWNEKEIATGEAWEYLKGEMNNARGN